MVQFAALHDMLTACHPPRLLHTVVRGALVMSSPPPHPLVTSVTLPTMTSPTSGVYLRGQVKYHTSICALFVWKSAFCAQHSPNTQWQQCGCCLTQSRMILCSC